MGDSGIAVVVGRVLDPETDDAVVDARVTLTWIETAFDSKGLRVHSYTRATTSDRAGEFHFCALPSGLVGNLRATGGTGTQLVVERELDLGQRILTITTLHLMVLPPDLANPRGLQAAAQAVLTGSVVRPDGSPLAAATAFVQGTADSVFTDDLGTFKLRGLPPGTHMVIVRALGFEPVSVAVELANTQPRNITVAMLTPAHVLDPILVEARQMQAGYARVGFDQRQRAGIGQFLTVDDIARKHAQQFSEIFNTVAGIRLTYQRDGSNVESSRGVAACVMYVLDGMPFDRLINGELDAMYQPADLGGIEIYAPAEVPVQFRVKTMPTTNEAGAPVDGRTDCTTIVVWTKTHLGIKN